MLNVVKLLANVIDVNSYDVVSTVDIRQGSTPVDFYIQLCQEKEGCPASEKRYIPTAPTTVQVEFLRADEISLAHTSRNVVKAAAVAFPGDTSIYKIILTTDDITNITTGGFRVTVVENTIKTTVIWSEMTLRKLPSSQVGV